MMLLWPAERKVKPTEIRYLEREGERVILGGLRAGRLWSLIRSESDGQMLGDAVWAAFGHWMAADQ